MHSRVVVRNVRVPIRGLPIEVDGLRIAHVSDLHFKDWHAVHAEAQRLLSELQYDLLAATGDFCHTPCGWRSAAAMCQRFFEPLSPPLGTFAVLGNHDDARLGMTDLPLVWLNNTSVEVNRGSTKVCIAGVQHDIAGNGSVERALSNAAVQPTILLAHFPSTAFAIPPGRAQVHLAGHTHGGQIRCPIFGALWTNDRIPRRMARGLHLVGRTWLHVNPGIGVSAPVRARFMCPAEITILELIGVGTPAEEVQTPTGRVASSRALPGKKQPERVAMRSRVSPPPTKEEIRIG
ncbi:MAG: hypothetical protein GY842_11305 [bacterium]|nr:hypothetical protein [bacterium]